jgi:hypothetical protein
MGGETKHSHRFVEEYNGLLGYGFSREVNEHTLRVFLQKFSDDEHMELILGRMSEDDMESLFNHLGQLLKTYLEEEEYHAAFLKDES